MDLLEPRDTEIRRHSTILSGDIPWACARATRSLLSAVYLRRTPAGLAPVIIGMAAAR